MSLENYRKVEVSESVDEKLPFSNLPSDIIHMTIKSGSRIRNILDFAVANFKPEECRNIVFSGTGNGVTKTITCVEIMKKIFKNVYQDNRICYHKIEDIWEPKVSELDSLKVTREVPALYVLLSKDPLSVPMEETQHMKEVLEISKEERDNDKPVYGKIRGGKWQTSKTKPKQPQRKINK